MSFVALFFIAVSFESGTHRSKYSHPQRLTGLLVVTFEMAVLFHFFEMAVFFHFVLFILLSIQEYA
ncbi:hypothetical protein UN63_11965 [Oceanisphaera arctica]|uniref:Uncharacterized protein n=1 Tax=Oceanisphaera arctica TaxID=641510 RepID=A0A2P5TKM2_9GAMM|nr:hypothetical protein UN63_11965 [Oceanisphaera arctica]